MVIKIRKNQFTGWTAVIISFIFINLWTFWGINENFHEGWYSEKLLENILMLFGQYLIVPIVFILLCIISLKWNITGSIIYFILGVLCFIFFGRRGIAAPFFIATPLFILGFLFLFGYVKNKKIAYFLIFVIPLIQIITIGSFNIIKVSKRVDDKNYGLRIIEGNGIELILAPEGPGWPDNGTPWEEARWICAHLSEDGTKILDEEVNIWRLPTIEEAVKIMVYHGLNAGGEWDSVNKKAKYKFTPDKETPLWNPHRKTIYLWTSTEFNKDEAYIITYNGNVRTEFKDRKADYLNFRAVKDR